MICLAISTQVLVNIASVFLFDFSSTEKKFAGQRPHKIQRKYILRIASLICSRSSQLQLVLFIGCLHQSWKNDRIVSRKILHVKLITCDSLPVFGCILEFSLSAFCYEIQHDRWWIVRWFLHVKPFYHDI